MECKKIEESLWVIGLIIYRAKIKYIATQRGSMENDDDNGNIKEIDIIDSQIKVMIVISIILRQILLWLLGWVDRSELYYFFDLVYFFTIINIIANNMTIPDNINIF